MLFKRIILILLMILPASLFCQDTLQEKVKKQHKFFEHQLCFGPQWIQWAWDKYNKASVEYLKQSYLGFYKITIAPKESIMKFSITLNASYATGTGYYSSYDSQYRDSYEGKFKNYWVDINPCVYFALGERKNLLIGGGPYYGKLIYTQNDIMRTVTHEPFGAAPIVTTTKDDKILNRTRAGATVEIQQKIVMKKEPGIIIGLRVLLTSTDGFAGTLVPAANPYIGIGF